MLKIADENRSQRWNEPAAEGGLPALVVRGVAVWAVTAWDEREKRKVQTVERFWPCIRGGTCLENTQTDTLALSRWPF